MSISNNEAEDRIEPAGMETAQPSGLYLLFATEMWERFSFYAMRALLVLYMSSATIEGGLGFSAPFSLKIYSYYLGIAYITPIIGGYIADRFLGSYRSALLGGLLMAIGHGLMAFRDVYFFYSALMFVAIGNGFFKPNITSILGQLYRERDPRRDGGYAIFYMGINVGGVLAGVSSGTLQKLYGYEAGFAAAALAMVLSLVVFASLAKTMLPVEATHQGGLKKNGKGQNRLSALDFDRLLVIVALTLALTLFIVPFEQIGGLLNIFAQRFVDRSPYIFGIQLMPWDIPTAYFQSLNPFFIVLFSPLISSIWLRLEERKCNPFYAQKMAIGLLLTALSWWIMLMIVPDTLCKSCSLHWGWLVLQNALTTLGELCILPVIWSCISAIAPRGYMSTLMACSMIAIGVGSWLSGEVGSLGLGDLGAVDFSCAEANEASVNMMSCKRVFWYLALTPTAAAAFLLLLSPRLERMARIGEGEEASGK